MDVEAGVGGLAQPVGYEIGEGAGVVGGGWGGETGSNKKRKKAVEITIATDASDHGLGVSRHPKAVF